MLPPDPALGDGTSELAEAQRIAQLGSFTWDALTDRTTWSDELFRIYGLPPGPASPPYEAQAAWYPPESKARLDAAVLALRATGRAYDLEYDIVRPDGTRRRLHSRAEPVFAPGGTIVMVRGVVLDVTDSQVAHVRLEARLRLEAGIAAMARRLASDPPAEAEGAIAEALAALGAHLGCDLVHLTEVETAETVILHEWWASGAGRRRRTGRVHARITSLAWSWPRLARGERVLVPDLRRLPPKAASEVAAWTALGMTARAALPIRPEGRTIGILGFADVERRAWAEDDLDLLVTIADLLGHALVRLREREMRERLAHASDALLAASAPVAPEGRRIAAMLAVAAEVAGTERAALVRGPAPWTVAGATGSAPGATAWAAIGGAAARRTRPRMDPAAGIVAVPVRGLGRGWGALVCGPGGPIGPLRPAELDWLESAARRIAGEVVRAEQAELLRSSAAAERARALQLRRLAGHLAEVRERERALLAREVHDDLGQVLGLLRSVALQVAGAEDLPGRLRGRCTDLADLASGALVASRRIIDDLRPPLLDELGIEGALRALATEHASRTRLAPRCRIAAAPADLPAALALDVYRVAQEALSNVARHADATEIGLTLAVADGRLRLSVTNDGVRRAAGGDAGTTARMAAALSADGRRYGITGMAERARRWDGELRAGRRGDRWVVRFVVPLPARGVGGEAAGRAALRAAADPR
ncbi:MAG: GAF domain-containing protein [Chloroflexota bacterium]